MAHLHTQMTDLHALSDGFAAGYLAYGLGLEAMWNGGHPTPMVECGKVALLGHAGEDFGSGAPIAAYSPQLRMGVALAVTSARLDGSPSGMNCSRPYDQNAYVVGIVKDALLNAALGAAGSPPACAPPPSYSSPPPLSSCVDAPSFGSLDGRAMGCGELLLHAVASSRSSVSSLCTNWLGRNSLADLRATWAAQNVTYLPPAGVDVDELAVELCRESCMRAGAGPCWLRGPRGRWC